MVRDLKAIVTGDSDPHKRLAVFDAATGNFLYLNGILAEHDTQGNAHPAHLQPPMDMPAIPPLEVGQHLSYLVGGKTEEGYFDQEEEMRSEQGAEIIAIHDLPTSEFDAILAKMGETNQSIDVARREILAKSAQRINMYQELIQAERAATGELLAEHLLQPKTFGDFYKPPQ